MKKFTYIKFFKLQKIDLKQIQKQINILLELSQNNSWKIFENITEILN